MKEQKTSTYPKTAILHYTAPPIIGGVEAVMLAQAQVLSQAHYPVTIIAGRGEKSALPADANFLLIPEIDSQNAEILNINTQIEKGVIPPSFEDMIERIAIMLSPALASFDNLIIHNVLTKHFNMPLTAALFRLLDRGMIRHCIAWCHDFTWTSIHSRGKMHPGYPWDLLRTYRQEITYVTVSKRRQSVLAELFECPEEKIQVIYNGVNPKTLLGLSAEGDHLVHRLELLQADLVIIMPVRVTQAKNIEYALHVVAQLKARGCKVKLVLTGPPDPHDKQSMAYFDSLKALRRQLEVENAMHFIYESGPDPDQPYTIDARIVGDLFRVSDIMFMPSHREGFGMPILEAGLLGIPAVCTQVPAAVEIGKENVLMFTPQKDAAQTAEQILQRLEENPAHRLRRETRQNYTWEALFERQIRPLIDKPGAP